MELAIANENAQEAGAGVEEAVHATQESLDKVRDILFGSQMREQDRRFTGLEEKFGAEFTAFQDETRKSLASLESFVKTELAALAGRLTTEANQREEAVGTLSEELKNTARGVADECRGVGQRIEKRVGEFDQQHAAAEADIRKQLLDTSNAAREELKATHAELHALVEKLVTDLRSAKTDRATLAGLFNEMAGRLQG
jgi:hypothetical protein